MKFQSMCEEKLERVDFGNSVEEINGAITDTVLGAAME